jgi:hypothetical protein
VGENFPLYFLTAWYSEIGRFKIRGKRNNILSTYLKSDPQVPTVSFISKENAF